MPTGPEDARATASARCAWGENKPTHIAKAARVNKWAQRRGQGHDQRQHFDEESGADQQENNITKVTTHTRKKTKSGNVVGLPKEANYINQEPNMMKPGRLCEETALMEERDDIEDDGHDSDI